MPYDLFISYSRKDNSNNRVTELKEEIETAYFEYAREKLNCFFDIEEIKGMEDWRHRILSGLRESNLLLLVLSPNYLVSPYCEWEIVEYFKYEYSRAAAGLGVAPIYFVEVPDLDTPEFVQTSATWVTLVRRRNHFDLRPWYDEGATALKRLDVRTRLDDLERSLQSRLSKLRRLAAAPGNLPAHNTHFVGREIEIQHLHESTGLGQFGVLTIIQGIGGIGKTTLAIQYAYAYADFYPGGRWIVRCASEKNLASIIRKLDSALGITFNEEEKHDDFRAACRILATMETRAISNAEARAGEKDPPAPRSLLILDNVDLIDLLQPPQSDLISGKRWLHILATTRLSGDDLGYNTDRQTLLFIDELTMEDAVRLLESHQPKGCFINTNELVAAEGIVKLLGGFTLAVEVAAVYLSERYGQITCFDFLERLRREGLAGMENIAKATRRAINHGQKLISATLLPTLDLLSPAESFILSCASNLPPDMIPVSWLRELARELYPHLGQDAPSGYDDPWLSVINHLLGMRLLQVVDIDHDHRVIRLVKMHRLIQSIIQSHTNFDDSRIVSYVRSRAIVLSFPGSWESKQIQWEVLAISATALLWLNRIDGAGVEIGAAISLALLDLEYSYEAEQLIETVARQCRITFGPLHYLTATCLNSYGDHLREMGRLDEAENAISEAIEIDRKYIDINPWHLARDYNNLGLLKYAKRSMAEAETNYFEGLRVLSGDALLDPDAILQKAILQHNLSNLYREQGHLNQAIKGFLSSIPVFESVLGSQHPYIAIVHNNLALTYHQSRLFNDAENAYRHSLHLNEVSLGSNHLLVAYSLHHLSILLCETRRSRDAIPLFRRAIGIMHLLHLLPGRDDKRLARMKEDFIYAAINSGYTWRQILDDEALVASVGVYLPFATFINHAIRAGQFSSVIKSFLKEILSLNDLFGHNYDRKYIQRNKEVKL